MIIKISNEIDSCVEFKGLFSMSHMSYAGTKEAERDEPSLAEMTLAAIEVLRKNQNGYVLFVEGGRIDHAHHQNLVSPRLHIIIQTIIVILPEGLHTSVTAKLYACFPCALQAHMALSETIAFSQAVDVADTMTSLKNTLIVVTSDHSHTMTINGYPSREDEIIGNVQRGDDTYSILSYANGPSADVHTYEQQSSKYGKPNSFSGVPKSGKISQHAAEYICLLC